MQPAETKGGCEPAAERIRVTVLVDDDLMQGREGVGGPGTEDGLQIGAGIGEEDSPRVAGGGNGRAGRHQLRQ